ncbi:unnamed protein product, partial [Rotaria magnacalcarata]
TINNHIGHLSNVPMSQLDSSINTYTNRSSVHRTQSNQPAWNSFETHANHQPTAPSTPPVLSYIHGSAIRPVPATPQRSLPPVPPRPYNGSSFS